MNFFSSSTSRLIIPRWKRPGAQTAAQDTLATAGKYASTEGRFSIIDERRKESTSMESSDSSSDDELDFKNSQTIFTKTRCENRVLSSSTTATTHTVPSQQQQQSDLKKSKQMSGSRFRIVPIESRYKRGRWACWDFYDSEPVKRLRERRAAPLPLNNRFSNSLTVKSFRSIQKAPMISSTEDVPLTAPPTDQQPPVSFSFDFSDESDTENRPTTETRGSRSKLHQISSTRPISQIKAVSDSTKNDADGQNKQRRPTTDTMEIEQTLGGRMTPVEMLHNFGLERSLSVTYNDNRSILELLPGTIPPVGSPRVSTNEQTDNNDAGRAARDATVRWTPPHTCLPREAREHQPSAKPIDPSAGTPAGGAATAAGSGTGANTPIVAIDSKIEQAMDLVKTHLMFAVREEVEVLRAKIIELEATILQLEAENAILREHVPAEILNKLSLQAGSSNPATTAAV